MKYFYLVFLTLISLPVFASAQTEPDTSKSAPISAPAHFFAGVALNSFSSNISSSTDQLNNAKSSKSTNPGFNLGVDIPLNQNATWLFRAEAGYTSNKDDFNYQYETGSVTQNTEQLSFKQGIINITPQIVFNVVKTNNLDAYISTGVNINIRNYSDKTYTTTVTYTVSGTTSTGATPEPNYKSATFCVPAQLGVVIAKHINIYAAYNAKTSLNNDSNLSINETSFTVGLNYIFGL